MRRIIGPCLLAAAIATPALARADLIDVTAEVWGGWKSYDPRGASAAAATLDDTQLLKGSFNAFGADAIVKLGLLELGVLYEGGLDYKSTKSMALAPLVGVGFDVLFLRFEALGEVGAQRYYDVAGTGESTWVPYAGIRPGVSVRLGLLGPARVVLGAWGFARWDLTTSTVNVSPTQRVEMGGSTVGVVGRLGVEL